ncbi:unnamed protein product [Diamesa serratosioi]
MKYLICVLVVVLGCQITLAQVQSSASVKIEVSINKTVTDFKSAMDKQQAAILKTLNTDAAYFYKDTKDAITAIVGTSVKVSNVGVDAATANHYGVVAEITADITKSLSTLFDVIKPEKLAAEVATAVDYYKVKFEEPMNEVRAKVKEVMAASPKSQACLEKALKDVTTLYAAANKNITASFTLTLKDFSANAKIDHANIKSNVTILTKAVDQCIAMKPKEAAYACLGVISQEKDKVLSLVAAKESDITQLYIDANLSLSSKADEIAAVISSKRDEILGKIAACAPQTPTVAPAVGVAVTIKA